MNFYNRLETWEVLRTFSRSHVFDVENMDLTTNFKIIA